MFVAYEAECFFNSVLEKVGRQLGGGSNVKALEIVGVASSNLSPCPLWSRAIAISRIPRDRSLTFEYTLNLIGRMKELQAIVRQT